LRNRIDISGFGKLVNRFLLHAFALRFGKFLIELGEPLCGDVLLVVQFPDLMLSLVSQPFGF